MNKMSIQPLNYAARAARDLREIVKQVVINPHSGEDQFGGKNFRRWADAIDRAIHFQLPMGGNILSDNLNILSKNPAAFPFDFFTVSCEPSKENDTCFAVCICHPKYIEIFSMHHNFDTPLHRRGRDFIPNWYSIRVLREEPVTDRGVINLYGPPFDDQNGSIVSDEDFDENINRNSLKGAYLVLELVEALSCPNVSQNIIQQSDPAINSRRIRAGKLPLHEIRTLTIMTPNSKTHSSASLGGTHADPREHLRRGHIRNLRGGRKVWIRPCVVNAGSPFGRVDKSYSVVCEK